MGEMQHAHLTTEFVSLPQAGGIVHIIRTSTVLSTSAKDICQEQATQQVASCGDGIYGECGRGQLNGELLVRQPEICGDWQW
jgi:hypothetical protein